MHRAINGELNADLALEVGNHPNTLSKLLRVQAVKDGLEFEWKNAMNVRRRNTALKNLERASDRN
jgi:hypothetical protein